MAGVWWGTPYNWDSVIQTRLLPNEEEIAHNVMMNRRALLATLVAVPAAEISSAKPIPVVTRRSIIDYGASWRLPWTEIIGNRFLPVYASNGTPLAQVFDSATGNIMSALEYWNYKKDNA